MRGVCACLRVFEVRVPVPIHTLILSVWWYVILRVYHFISPLCIFLQTPKPVLPAGVVVPGGRRADPRVRRHGLLLRAICSAPRYVLHSVTKANTFHINKTQRFFEGIHLKLSISVKAQQCSTLVHYVSGVTHARKNAKQFMYDFVSDISCHTKVVII